MTINENQRKETLKIEAIRSVSSLALAASYCEEKAKK